jgi:hypothetical protein
LQQNRGSKPPPYPGVYSGMAINTAALPAPPHPVYNWNPYTCSVCQVGFNSYEILMCHVKLYHCHQQFSFNYGEVPSGHLVPPNLLHPYYNGNPAYGHGSVPRGVCPKPQSGKKCSCADCQRTKVSTASVERPVKRKRVEKEDLDEATLAKMREMEWERRKGYWCTKCNVRFESQVGLVDHMSSQDHAAKK